MEFCKYQGTGNDFIIVDSMKGGDDFDRDKIASVCDRHFGVGADGFIAAVSSEKADVRMAFYNSDGSEASMCGNGIRCFSKFVRDHGIVKEDRFTVETGDGVKHIVMIEEKPKTSVVKVDMGKYSDFRSVEWPRFGRIYAAHLGVPHAVLFMKTDGRHMEALDEEAMRSGRSIEFSPAFQPDRTNVNFVEIIDRGHILCSTWERGAGKTLACGTGACSSAAASRLFMGCGDAIRVTMPGGEVVVSFEDEIHEILGENRRISGVSGEEGSAGFSGDVSCHTGKEKKIVFMQGSAVLICRGHIEED